jgi:hypothetical protein
MSEGRHGVDQVTFEELDFQGQARSLNATLRLYLPQAIRAHAKKDPARHDETLRTCIKLIENLKTDVESLLQMPVAPRS